MFTNGTLFSFHTRTPYRRQGSAIETMTPAQLRKQAAIAGYGKEWQAKHPAGDSRNEELRNMLIRDRRQNAAKQVSRLLAYSIVILPRAAFL